MKKQEKNNYKGYLLIRYLPIPGYAFRLIVVMLLVNCAVYFGSRIFCDGRYHYDLSSGLDRLIPFIPAFIIVYLLAFVQWIIGYILIARDERSVCYRIMRGEIFAKIITGIIFFILPTTMTRAAVHGNDIFSRLVLLVYQIDAPINLFPSIHCLESWVILRAAFIGNTKSWYKICMVIMSILVFLSTLFVKQHVAADVLGGIIIAEVGIIIGAHMVPAA